jgi:replication factor C subunit 3/5
MLDCEYTEDDEEYVENEKSEDDEEIEQTEIPKKKKDRKIVDPLKMYNETMDWIKQFQEDTIVTEKKQENTTLPWVEKFRPQNLDEVISHENIISTLKTLIHKNQFPHLLLSGPPGTGKTSAIMACARELYGKNYSIMVLDINASEERGIEVVRNKIKNFISTKGVFLSKDSSMFKLVILDEADAMTIDAQSMLVSVIDKFTINVRFCLICNYIKKISPQIQSRCTIFKFSPLSKSDITKKLNDISSKMKLKISKDGIDTIIKISRGDMRKVLNILQATSMAYDTINSENVTNCIGYPTSKHMDTILASLIKDPYSKCYNDISLLISKNGYSLMDILTELTDLVMANFINKKISQDKVASILGNMREIEMNLTLCPSESIQLSGLVGLFKLAFVDDIKTVTKNRKK